MLILSEADKSKPKQHRPRADATEPRQDIDLNDVEDPEAAKPEGSKSGSAQAEERRNGEAPKPAAPGISTGNPKYPKLRGNSNAANCCPSATKGRASSRDIPRTNATTSGRAKLLDNIGKSVWAMHDAGIADPTWAELLGNKKGSGFRRSDAGAANPHLDRPPAKMEESGCARLLGSMDKSSLASCGTSAAGSTCAKDCRGELKPSFAAAEIDAMDPALTQLRANNEGSGWLLSTTEDRLPSRTYPTHDTRLSTRAKLRSGRKLPNVAHAEADAAGPTLENALSGNALPGCAPSETKAEKPRQETPHTGAAASTHADDRSGGREPGHM